jgi:Flp pilus assembly pilin Flp
VKEIVMSKAMLRWRQRVAERMQGRESESGAGAIEYAGIVIIVAGIILAIRGLGLDATISSAIGTWVNAVVGGGE